MMKWRTISMNSTIIYMPLLLLLLSFGMLCSGKSLIARPATTAAISAATTLNVPTKTIAKQLLFDGAQGKETNTPNFVRLVMMRLIYGLASTMGLEERLEGAFNGIFVPPNADEGDLFGGSDGGDAVDAIQLFGGGDGGGGDDLLDGLFDADY